MKCLVTGASGFIGSTLVHRLVRDGHHVRCLVHRSFERLKELDVELVPGSVTEPDCLQTATKGMEVVFHLAARATDWGKLSTFMRVNADGTANLLSAASSAGVRRFVHMSSLAVHRFTGHADADENVPADQDRFAYGISKAAAEKRVRSACRAGTIETVVIRPGAVIFGPEDTTAFIHMAPLLARGRWTHVAGGRPLMCYSYVDNLVDGLILAAGHPRAKGEVFVITDGLKLNWREFIQAVIGAFERSPMTLSVPAWLAISLGWSAERCFKLFHAENPPPITEYRTALVARDFHFTCEKACQVLGYQPEVSLEEGLRRTVAWYRCSQTTAS